MPRRQFLAALAWLDEQWNAPDRHDHYVMQQTAAVIGSRGKDAARKVTLEKLKIPFRRKTQVHTTEGAAAISKAIWGARLSIAMEAQRREAEDRREPDRS